MKAAELRNEARSVREAAANFAPELARLMLELADEIDSEAAAEEAKAAPASRLPSPRDPPENGCN